MSRHKDSQVVLEDAEFLAASGVGLEEAATRIGYGHYDSLVSALRRAGRGDIAARLRANQPPKEPEVDKTNSIGGYSIWRPAHLYRETA